MVWPLSGRPSPASLPALSVVAAVRQPAVQGGLSARAAELVCPPLGSCLAVVQLSVITLQEVMRH